MMRPVQLALALSFLAAGLAPGCARPPERYPQGPKIPREDPRPLEVPTVRFVVRTNPVSGTLYLTGNFNDWEPGERAFAFERTVELPNSVLWSLDIERGHLGPPPIEFKFTRGTWDSVETDGAFEQVPNRVITPAQLENWPDEVIYVLDFRVPAFEDQRVGAFATGPPSRSVVGRLERLELESEPLGNTRAVSVWLPPGYDAPANAELRYPVLYLQDGQNLFDGTRSFSGKEWRVDETCTRLIEEERIPPIVVVGIDNAGLARAPEYNPPEMNFPGGPGRGDRYVDFLVQELLPAVERRYRVAREPASRALGGSSFGANISLYAAMRAPDTFGALLLESPSVGHQGGVMLELVRGHASWPLRIAIGVGQAEPDRFVESVVELEQLLKERGLGPDELLLVISPDAGHDEQAWAERLPAELEFLYAE